MDSSLIPVPDAFPWDDEGDDLTVSLERSRIAEEEERLRQAAEAYLARRTQLGGTQRFPGEIAALLPIPSLAAAICNARRPSARSYQVLPARLADRRPDGIMWRIELHSIETGADSAGLDICGDTVLGRGTDPLAAPDLDLDPFGAADMGVSRRHALLRPSRQRLYLIDLQSTNGTRCNGVLLGPGSVHILVHNDTISLGALTLQIKIVRSPDMLCEDGLTTDGPTPINPFA